MKKILFATTALALSAGVAAAEVKVGGDGRMGVVYNGKDWDFSSRVRVKFNASAQTDGGLEFGGSIRADNAKDGKQGTAGSVYISGALGKLSMGDIDSAPKALFDDFNSVGYEGLANQNETDDGIPYLIDDDGKQGPRVLYEGTFGDFSIAASMSDGRSTVKEEDTYAVKTGAKVETTIEKAATKTDTGISEIKKDIPVTKTAGEEQKNQKADQELAVAAAYSFGDYTVGAGYEYISAAGDKHDQGQAMLNGEATFGDTTVRLAYAKGYKANKLDQWYGLGVSSVFGATTLNGYVQHKELKDAQKDDETWYGIGASYDLGGGATLAAGLAKSDAKDADDVTADLGIKFKF